ncbi:MAG: hypothetical protein JXR19_09330 [Bacteroidia bacterium]
MANNKAYKRATILLAISTLLLAAWSIYSYLQLKAHQESLAELRKVEAVNGPMEEQVVLQQFQMDSLIESNSLIQSELKKLEKFQDSAQGVYFEVQLGIFKHFNLSDYQQEMVHIRQDTLGEHQIILLGRFTDINRAQDFQKELLKLGLNTTYLAGRINGEFVTKEEAISALEQATI